MVLRPLHLQFLLLGQRKFLAPPYQARLALQFQFQFQFQFQYRPPCQLLVLPKSLRNKVLKLAL